MTALTIHHGLDSWPSQGLAFGLELMTCGGSYVGKKTLLAVLYQKQVVANAQNQIWPNRKDGIFDARVKPAATDTAMAMATATGYNHSHSPRPGPKGTGPKAQAHRLRPTPGGSWVVG